MSTRTSLLNRFDELIAHAEALLKSFNVSSLKSLAELARWKTACLHLIDNTFGKDNVYHENLKAALGLRNLKARITHGMAIMQGAKEEIEKGFLYKVEHLIAADLFDSILEQAEHLLGSGFKDAAAILGRVIIEKSLKEIAKRENVFPEKVKLSKLNEILWKKGIYAKNVWRVTQGHIDTGNFAAHGNFNKYNEQSVKDLLKWIRETILNL